MDIIISKLRKRVLRVVPILSLSKSHNCKPRSDLSSIVYKSKELESIYVEIYKLGKNVIISCIF